MLDHREPHAGQAHVQPVARAAVDLGRNVLALQRLADGLELGVGHQRRTGGWAQQRRSSSHLAIAAAGTAAVADHAVGDLVVAAVGVALGVHCRTHQHLARGGTGVTQAPVVVAHHARAHGVDRAAHRCRAGQGRCALHQRHAHRVDHQVFGQDLGQALERALAHVRRSDGQRDAVVAGHGEPGVHGSAGRGGGIGGAGGHQPGQGKGQRQAGAGAQELAAIDAEGGFHDRSPGVGFRASPRPT